MFGIEHLLSDYFSQSQSKHEPLSYVAQCLELSICSSASLTYSHTHYHLYLLLWWDLFSCWFSDSHSQSQTRIIKSHCPFASCLTPMQPYLEFMFFDFWSSGWFGWLCKTTRKSGFQGLQLAYLLFRTNRCPGATSVATGGLKQTCACDTLRLVNY